LLKTKKNELENNFTAIPLSTGKTLDVLNSVVIYGANASGKSNLIEDRHNEPHHQSNLIQTL
jgi:AAA15 family ATPase/GTPase